MTQPSITLFGSQNDVPDHRYLSNTRTTLLANSEYSPFIQAIKELPQIWETVTQSYEALQNVPGLHFLSQLREWIENGRSISFPEHSPNVLLAPITVITQVADWLSYFRSDSSTGCQSYPNHTLESHSFQGLCVGMLTAIAFGTTRDIPGLMSQAGVAIRLAVLIGAVVDLDGEYAVSPKRWTSIIARFRGSGRTQIEEVISRHPDVS